MPQPIRSVLAVIVGYFTMVVLVVVCTLAFARLFHVELGHPPVGYLAMDIVYSAIAAFAGGWLAAYIAGQRPLLHGAVLAALVFLLSAISFAHPLPGQSTMYRAVLTLLMPLAVLGGAATEKH